jgi:uncharacterized protein YbjT (DUF2867 family)
MRDKKIVVFGGSGFLGRTLVQKLAQMGARIRVACRAPQHANHLRTRGEVGQVNPITCNITNYEAVRQVTEGADIVFNLAGIMAQKGKQTFENVHVMGALNIARACAENNITRLIHISALGADAASSSLYARTKAAGEYNILKYFPQATILRPSLIFGKDDHFFNLFAQMAMISPILPLIGGGHTKFQPVYVSDVADSMVAAAEQEKAKGKIFEIAGPQVYTFKQLLELIMEMTGRKRWLITIPFCLATALGKVLELFPSPLLTADQVKLLKTDAIPGENVLAITDLGITTQSLSAILPTYLQRFHKHF